MDPMMPSTPPRAEPPGEASPWPPSSRETDAPASWLPATLAVITALTLLRLAASKLSVVDLFYDEAQYWSWSRDLAWGYYSKPPLLAWVIALAEHACGSDEWCIRAPSPIFHGATSLVAYAIGRFLYDGRTGFWAALLTALGTGVVFSSRIISTDVPLLFFFALALLAYFHLLAVPSWRWTIVLGASIGLGLLSKYAMVYFLPGVALAAVVSKHARLAFARPEIWLALGLAAVVVAPNIAWNVSNSFATFQHTGGLVVGEPVRLSIMRGLEFLGSQIAVFGPIAFAAAVFATLRFGSRQSPEPDRILVAFFIPALVVVTGFAIAVKAYANWAAVSCVPAAVLGAAILSRHHARWWMGAGVAIGVATQLTLIGTDAVADRLSLPHLANPYRRTIGWREFATRAGQVARQVGARTIASGSRSELSELQYYWRDQPEKVLWWRSVELPEFELKEGLSRSSPEPILFVTGCASFDLARKLYAEVEPVGSYAVPIGKRPEDGTRVFHAFRLSGPRGPIPPLDAC